MSLLDAIRERISPQNPMLLLYHKCVAMLAAIWYRFPASRLKVIAVTGTKGKSTTVHLIARVLQDAGFRVGVSSSIHFQIGENVWQNDTKQTTLGRFKLHQLLRMMVDEKCEFAVIEVTSHALIQSRLWGINVDCAVLTNMEKDHLEYHGGFENYMHAKGLLFSNLARSERKFGLQKTAVLPADDPHVNYFDQFSVDRKISYGLGKGMVRASEIMPRADGTKFVLQVPNAQVQVDFKFPGEFNVRNALAACAVALSFGIKLSAIQKGLESEFTIPGRIEVIRAGQPFTLVVDYAHTVDSLDKMLTLFRGLTRGKLWVVFGATGGGRDKAKRPEMGRIVASYAENIIVTDDDSYTEDRMSIMNQVAAGIERREGQGLWKIRDRRQAIRLACSFAEAQDTVIIAGKGCEPVQLIDGKRIEWDDRKIAREIVSSELVVKL